MRKLEAREPSLKCTSTIYNICCGNNPKKKITQKYQNTVMQIDPMPYIST
jgi:hypothetical protein